MQNVSFWAACHWALFSSTSFLFLPFFIFHFPAFFVVIKPTCWYDDWPSVYDDGFFFMLMRMRMRNNSTQGLNTEHISKFIHKNDTSTSSYICKFVVFFLFQLKCLRHHHHNSMRKIKLNQFSLRHGRILCFCSWPSQVHWNGCHHVKTNSREKKPVKLIKTKSLDCMLIDAFFVCFLSCIINSAIVMEQHQMTRNFNTATRDWFKWVRIIQKIH